MGTVISPASLTRIEAIVNNRGKAARVLAGGERLAGLSALDQFDFSRGSFYPPTVITDVETQDDLWREEVFGPVVVVKRFSVRSCPDLTFTSCSVLMCHQDENEGVMLANASKYALGAGIWTNDLSRAHRVAGDIESGLVWVNTHHRNDPSSPW